MDDRQEGRWMKPELTVCCGDDALGKLLQYCHELGWSRFLLVADENTYAALGRRAEAALRATGWEVRNATLSGEHILPDEHRVIEVLSEARGEVWVYVAVGSGTITDITRYASYCSRNPFVSLPTAPSVDAYSTGGAAVILNGVKRTVPAHPPVAVFADLATLCEAPREMIAAGFGDMLGKHTSLADWRLGALLLDEQYDEQVAERAERMLLRCEEHVDQVGRASSDGVRTLMEALLESGLCMLEYGSSRPASGFEHLISHFWDMMRRQQGHAAPLHGAMVGVGTVLAAQRYEAIRAIPEESVASRLETAPPPNLEDELGRIRGQFAPYAESVIGHYQPFFGFLQTNWQRLRVGIAQSWPQILSIANRVPSPQRLARMLQRASAPDDARSLGLVTADVERALELSHYLRGRFTVDTLGRMLGV
jgi:glycerol-1-phosphate dehydrogenase [NAD(P)+]